MQGWTTLNTDAASPYCGAGKFVNCTMHVYAASEQDQLDMLTLKH